MTTFKEADEVEFDVENFALHKKCGKRLTEVWSVTRDENWFLKRDGKTVLAEYGDNDRSCNGIWCNICDEQVSMTVEK